MLARFIHCFIGRCLYSLCFANLHWSLIMWSNFMPLCKVTGAAILRVYSRPKYETEATLICDEVRKFRHEWSFWSISRTCFANTRLMKPLIFKYPTENNGEGRCLMGYTSHCLSHYSTIWVLNWFTVSYSILLTLSGCIMAIIYSLHAPYGNRKIWAPLSNVSREPKLLPSYSLVDQFDV